MCVLKSSNNKPFTINKYLLFRLSATCKKDINSVYINSCHYICKAIMYYCIEIITVKLKKKRPSEQTDHR